MSEPKRKLGDLSWDEKEKVIFPPQVAGEGAPANSAEVYDFSAWSTGKKVVVGIIFGLAMLVLGGLLLTWNSEWMKDEVRFSFILPLISLLIIFGIGFTAGWEWAGGVIFCFAALAFGWFVVLLCDLAPGSSNGLTALLLALPFTVILTGFGFAALYGRKGVGWFLLVAGLLGLLLLRGLFMLEIFMVLAGAVMSLVPRQEFLGEK